MRHSAQVRPAISPGLAVLRRDRSHLQLGCNPGVVIDDRPGLYAFLRHLDGIRDIDALRRHRRRHFPELADDIEQVLRPLLAVGAVVDLDTDAGGPPQPAIGLRYDVAATGLAAVVGQALADLRIPVGPDPDLTLIISTGEPRRASLDAMVRSGAPHLAVVLDGPSVRIGPCVVPGRTPCVQCLDRHRSTWHPAWSALVPQFGQPISDTAVTPAVRLSAAAVISEEVARFAAGGRPLTCSCVLEVGPGLATRVVGDTAFHPRCSCAVLLAA